MRNQTQERIEELARERGTTIDLELVGEGIEIGKRMMAEMIANYPSQRQNTTVAPTARDASQEGNGNGYLNEVRPLRDV
jgi:hypothetical protein